MVGISDATGDRLRQMAEALEITPPAEGFADDAHRAECLHAIIGSDVRSATDIFVAAALSLIPMLVPRVMSDVRRAAVIRGVALALEAEARRLDPPAPTS